MKEFISKWSNWWILNPRRKQLDDAFEKELNELIEREVALRIHAVVGRSEQLTPKYTPCGGCGADNPNDRCINCFHDFGGNLLQR